MRLQREEQDRRTRSPEPIDSLASGTTEAEGNDSTNASSRVPRLDRRMQLIIRCCECVTGMTREALATHLLATRVTHESQSPMRTCPVLIVE